MTDIKPSPNGLLAYCALAHACSGPDGRCKDAGLPTLARSVGISESTMRRGLRELQKLKAVRVRARYRVVKGKRRMGSNEYVLVDLTRRGTTPL